MPASKNLIKELERRKKISEALKKYYANGGKSPRGMLGKVGWNKGKHPNYVQGKNHPYWKGGVSKDRKYKTMKLKEWRHKKGISKKYISELDGELRISYTKEYRRKYNKFWKQTAKGRISQKINNLIHRTRIKDLTIKIIQLIYEDNIKKFGTLTCYLCLQPIEFKKDHLEHKIPLSRGGTNEYNNLAIACQKCNCNKYTKTEEEYREECLKK